MCERGLINGDCQNTNLNGSCGKCPELGEGVYQP